MHAVLIAANQNRFAYELLNIAKLFFHEVQKTDDLTGVIKAKNVVVLDFQEKTETLVVTVSAAKAGVVLFSESCEGPSAVTGPVEARPFKRQVLKLFYKALQVLKPTELPWGFLTGVRPVKVVHEWIDQGLAITDIQQQLREDLFIDDDKVELLLEVALKERAMIFPSHIGGYSLYIGIPFCPSRCHYCSFPSHPSSNTRLLNAYFEALCKELEAILPILDPNNADSLYIGGGTPSVLSPQQIQRLKQLIDSHIPDEQWREKSFEAGRPETLTSETIAAIKSCGFDRICLNPQSFNAKTLAAVGRTHSPEAIEACYTQLQAAGFKTINMDLIAGLPGETLEDWEWTLKRIEALMPQNVTVHTLALKSGAELKTSGYVTEEHLVTHMVTAARKQLKGLGYDAYYLYRQKYIADNLENVGYSLSGHESRYNMLIMEERESIIAFGVGAVSKITFEGDRFERLANPRDIKHYIEHIDEVIAKKHQLI